MGDVNAEFEYVFIHRCMKNVGIYLVRLDLQIGGVADSYSVVGVGS